MKKFKKAITGIAMAAVMTVSGMSMLPATVIEANAASKSTVQAQNPAPFRISDIDRDPVAEKKYGGTWVKVKLHSTVEFGKVNDYYDFQTGFGSGFTANGVQLYAYNFKTGKWEIPNTKKAGIVESGFSSFYADRNKRTKEYGSVKINGEYFYMGQFLKLAVVPADRVMDAAGNIKTVKYATSVLDSYREYDISYYNAIYDKFYDEVPIFLRF